MQAARCGCASLKSFSNIIHKKRQAINDGLSFSFYTHAPRRTLCTGAYLIFPVRGLPLFIGFQTLHHVDLFEFFMHKQADDRRKRPVSYTHLDVYKRQELNKAVRSGKNGRPHTAGFSFIVS